jgi:hypothetical protein
MNLVVTLENDKECKDVVFEIFNTDIAYRWAIEIGMNYRLYETDRFKGWPNSNKNLSYYIHEINKQIITVNLYKSNTINSVVSEYNQDLLNYLHKFFETLRGPVNEGTDFYNQAPTEVKNAIDRFNVLIHECEHLLREQDQPTIVVTFQDRLRYDLKDCDYDHFTFKWEFGTVYINYCEIGKPLLDVFKDQDMHVGLDNIRPLKFYSADFMIKFGPNVLEEYYQERLKNFWNWYNKQNYKFDKSKLSLGLIPVAKIVDDRNQKSIIESLSCYKRVRSVCIK